MATKKVVKDDSPETCANCKFSQIEPAELAGYCRRYPPVLLEVDEGEPAFGFPVIEHRETCGEFKRNLS